MEVIRIFGARLPIPVGKQGLALYGFRTTHAVNQYEFRTAHEVRRGKPHVSIECSFSMLFLIEASSPFSPGS